jgi:hypothetical protein
VICHADFQAAVAADAQHSLGDGAGLIRRRRCAAERGRQLPRGGWRLRAQLLTGLPAITVLPCSPPLPAPSHYGDELAIA